MKWAKGLCSFAALAAPVAVHAQVQTGRITGTVTIAPGGQPLTGANVLVVGTEVRGSTGPDGRFVLNGVPVGARQIRVQRIGYAPVTQSVTVTAGQAVAVTTVLQPQAVQLAEIVSVGYGTQSRRDVTGSVATVTTEALDKAPVSTIDQVLQGTAPGVQVTTASSEPGGALSIRIRGTSSITGSSEPLYVVDGFPIENDIEAASAGNGGRARTTPPNPLSTLNPSDIESISILKDAASTAIYGARGANGVVIINTRQGRGTRPQFSLETYAGAATVAKEYALLNAEQYMDYANTFAANASTPFTPFPDSVRSRILAAGTNTNWQDEIFRTAGVRNLQLSVRGATTAASPTRYNLSGGLFDQQGVVVGSGLRRLSTRLNLNQAFGTRVEIGGSFTASQARSKAVPTSGQQNAGAGAISGALQYVPILPVRRADGTYSYINTDLNAFATQLDAPQTPNPVSLAREVKDSLSDTRLLGNVFGQVDLVEGLRFRTTFGADNADRWRYTYYPRTTLRGEQARGEAIRGSTATTSWVNENTLTYQREFAGIHNVDLLGGYSRQHTDVDGENMNNTNFVSDITGYYDIGAGTQQGGPGVSSRRTAQALESWLSRVNYSLLDRYLFSVTGRRDGSSRFGADNRWGFFPAASAGWRVSEERFMRAVPAVSNLKLRYSYGSAGNPSISPYQSLNRLLPQQYTFGGQVAPGYVPAAIGNPELSWESTKQSDVGLDLGLFGDRVDLTADYYRKRTDDLLLEISLPSEVGYAGAFVNAGSVENKGFEVGLTLRVLEGGQRGLRWSSTFNYARNRNRVLDLGGVNRIFARQQTLSDIGATSSVVQVGQPIGAFFGYQTAGLFRDTVTLNAWKAKTRLESGTPTLGNVQYVDVDGNGVINALDRTTIGDPNPKFTLGWQNTLSFRGFELSGLLDGSYGNQILNLNNIRLGGASPSTNVLRERVADAWTPENPDGRWQRIGAGFGQQGTDITSEVLENGSYLRLRTVTLGRAIPTGWLRTGGGGARAYVTAQNLVTWSKYSGFNPDVS